MLTAKRSSMNYKEALEQLQLINELNDIEKSILLKLIETFVSRKQINKICKKTLLYYKQKSLVLQGFLFLLWYDN